MRIARGDSVAFSTSLCPLPLINIGAYDSDWFEGITRKLKWNQSIRGVPAVPAAALSQQLHVDGLISNLACAAANEAKVAGWVEEALQADAVGAPPASDGRPRSSVNGTSHRRQRR
jgi:NAD+ kinase